MTTTLPSSSVVLVMTLWLQAPSVFVTHASNVRLRASASESSAVVRSVPLGTELTGLGADGGVWLRMRTADGAVGFVSASLVRAVTPASRFSVLEEVAVARLAREGDGFVAQLELLELVERLAGEARDAETRGRLALHRLRAIDRVLTAIPFRDATSGVEPYAAWLKTREGLLNYNEPGGRWMIHYQQVRIVHDAHRGTAAADDIAWFGVTNGVGGECEGDHGCAVWRSNELSGEYLRRHPDGRHAAEAVGLVTEAYADVPTPPAPLIDLNPVVPCSAIIKGIVPLRAAVAATSVPERAAALAVLDRLRSHCKPT